MELKEEIRIAAPRETVFAALNDPEILRQAIPGCEEIEALSDHEFAATVSAKVGPLKARFKGQVALSDIVPPESYTLSGEGRGGPAGHAKVSAAVALVEDGSATLLRYEVKAVIGGKLAQLGGQLVQNTAEKLAGEFFRNFEQIVSPADNDTDNNTADAAIAATQETTDVTPSAWGPAAIAVAMAVAAAVAAWMLL